MIGNGKVYNWYEEKNNIDSDTMQTYGNTIYMYLLCNGVYFCIGGNK